MGEGWTRMSTKLSPTQEEAVAYLRKHGGTLWRWPGGFWTTADTPDAGEAREGQGGPADGHTWGVPVWYIGTNTVMALERKGVLERTNAYPERWRDTRRLTEAWR